MECEGSHEDCVSATEAQSSAAARELLNQLPSGISRQGVQSSSEQGHEEGNRQCPPTPGPG